MLEVRAATAADAHAISGLAREVQAVHAAALPSIFRLPDEATFPSARIEALAATPGHHFFVAVDDGVVVGYAYAIVQRGDVTPWHHPRTVVSLDQMGVAAAHRRRGAGGALVDAVRALAASNEAAEVRLNVWTFNDEARAFYARHGFVSYTERLRLPMTAGERKATPEATPDAASDAAPDAGA